MVFVVLFRLLNCRHRCDDTWVCCPAATNGPIVWLTVKCRALVEGYWQGENWHTQRKPCPNITLLITRSTWTALGTDLGLCSDNPETDTVTCLIDKDRNTYHRKNVLKICCEMVSHEDSGLLGCDTVLLDEWFPRFWRILVPSWITWPWRWRQCDLLKQWELLTQRHSVTSQNIWIFSSTAMRTHMSPVFIHLQR